MTREQAEIEVAKILQDLETASGSVIRSIDIEGTEITQVSDVGKCFAMPEIRDRLLVIASRSRSGCSQEDAERVAYLLYRMLQPDLVH